MLKEVLRIANTILGNFNYKLSRTGLSCEKKLELYRKILSTHADAECKSIGAIIFSMNRALQLDALLRSFFLNKSGACKVVVIYKASTQEHEVSYREVIERFKGKVEFLQERDRAFKEVLLSTIDLLRTDKLFFLVDDVIFIRKVDFGKLIKIDTNKFIFSLRMGEHLNYSYVVNKDQKLPRFTKKNDECIFWEWGKSELDWSYPLSVDGHIFNRIEIRSLIEFCDFLAPNSLENSLQVERGLFSEKAGMSYRQARIVNNPCNKVQEEVENLHGSLHQDQLLGIWNSGKQVNIDILQGYTNKSVHEDILFKFEDRQ